MRELTLFGECLIILTTTYKGLSILLLKNGLLLRKTALTMLLILGLNGNSDYFSIFFIFIEFVFSSFFLPLSILWWYFFPLYWKASINEISLPLYY